MEEKSLYERLAALQQTDDQKEPHILKARLKHARSYVAWSEEENQILIEFYQKNPSVSYFSQLLKRSSGAVQKRIELLGIENPRNQNQPLKETFAQPQDEVKEKDKIKHDPIYQMIRYWRNSLADAEKMGLSADKMRQGEEFSLSEYEAAQLPPERIRRFFDEAEQELREKNKRKTNQQKDEEEVTINKLQVIIAPYTAVKDIEYGKKVMADKGPAKVLPLWLVANLTREGKLIPGDETIYPWIERRCLTPNEDKTDAAGYPIIGDVSQVDEFYVKDADLFDEGTVVWEKLFSFAMDLFRLFLSKNENVFPEQSYVLKESGYILPARDIKEAAKSIISTYDQYLFTDKKEIPELLKKFSTLQDHEHCADKSKEALFLASQTHLGQMQNKYPLSNSQRVCMSYLEDNENNNIFTVHGPPGTGKTSLLLSVIASKWVDAAIQKQPPPIIVAASTNNLAVTNILDNFNHVSLLNTQGDSIRWLPEFNSYGLYLVSKSEKNIEAAIEKDYPFRLKGKALGSVEKFYTKEYREDATTYFLQQFNKHYRCSEVALGACQQFIHDQMLLKHAQLQNVIKFCEQFYRTQVEIRQRYGDIDAVAERIVKQSNEKKALKTHLEMFKSVRNNWLVYKTSDIYWLRLFAWLPFVKALLSDRVKLFTARYHEIFPEVIGQLDEVDEILDRKLNEKNLNNKKIENALNELILLKTCYEESTKTKVTLEQQLGFEFSLDDSLNFSDESNVLCKLDQTIRYDLFLLASHYWEVTWLLKSETMGSLLNDEEGRREYWRIQAMLTPCFVTTLHTGPGFFQYKNSSQQFETLANFVDLLIIDEAGQVMPAVAGALISVAKNLLLVGDTKQIEPIFTLSAGIDMANAKKFGLCTDIKDYEQLKKVGVLCSGDAATGHAYGNVVVVGQRKAKFHLKELILPGILLTEHRRCAKEIISYCNELCYDNQLIAMTHEQPCIYPRMGYAHIKGHEEKSGTSRCNKPEAEAIAAWIAKNKDKILAMCKATDLKQCIGIVTPFGPQRNALQLALSDRNIALDKVGTIHSLQGAQKPIIIFSSVYTAREQQANFFFDKSPNMLNVAVSRAEMSFLVFGDMDIFDPQKGKSPSSLLAKYLFASEQNEIIDIVQPQFKYIGDKEIQQINSLEQHRAELKKSFVSAESELNIVSPFLRVSAIESDNIVELIRKNARRIAVCIYTDPTLNQNHYQEFRRAIAMLESAGATVQLVNNVHSKVITIDNRIIIEGSFNWLSAARVNSQFKREESSIIYAGKYASRFIQQAIKPIQAKISKVNDHETSA